MALEAFTLCGSALCTNNAEVTVFWPGQTVHMCRLCAMRAKTIASAMGFDLDVRDLQVPQPEVR